MARAEESKQKHKRPPRPRIRMVISSLGCHSIGQSTVMRLSQVQGGMGKIPPIDEVSCKITLSMVWI